MTIQQIYIHLIDGTDVWVPVNARWIRDAQFEILDNNTYHEVNSTELFEFFPGDIIETEERALFDGIKGPVAAKLIVTGPWPDRKFNEFKYKASLKKLNIDKQTAQTFRTEIERVKKEVSAGQIFYPTIIETTNQLDILINPHGKT